MRPTWTIRLVCFSILLSGSAAASPSFPPAIQEWLQANGYPDAPQPLCTICHRDMAGNLGTVIKPFGKFLHEERGLQAAQVDTLKGLLDELKFTGHDTDGDGFSDIDELGKGWDPNIRNLADGGIDPNAPKLNEVTPGYGCSISLTRSDGPTEPRGSTAALGGLGLMLVARRLRSRKSRS